MPRPKKPNTIDLKFRVSIDLRNRLEQAAAERGVSLNAEITDRLARSVREKRYWEKVEDPKAAGIIEALSQVVLAVGQNAGTLARMSQPGGVPWYESPYAFEQVARGVVRTLEYVRPAGDIISPEPHGRPAPEFFERIGKMVADGLFAEIGNASTSLPAERVERAENIRKALGPELLALIKHRSERMP